MELTRRDFFKAGLLAGAFTMLPKTAKAAGPPSILWIGWDGADYRVVTDMLAAGLLPNLARLHTGRLDCAGATVTKPGWVEIVNGLEYPQTGVLTNKEFQPVELEGILFYRIKAAMPNYWCGCVFSKKRHTGDREGEPWYQLGVWARDGGMEFYRNAGDSRFSTHETNQEMVEALISYAPPGLMFCHYARPDMTGHHWGMGSEEYLRETAKLDHALGRAIEAMQPDIVIVCSDHGFNGYGLHSHNHAPDGFISSNVPLKDNGVRRDVGYTVAGMLGLPVEEFDPPLRGKDLRL